MPSNIDIDNTEYDDIEDPDQVIEIVNEAIIDIENYDAMYSQGLIKEIESNFDYSFTDGYTEYECDDPLYYLMLFERGY